MNIREGDRFPDVSGRTHDGKEIHLADFQGKQNVVLYFYPRDLTPGCTREAIDFDRKLGDFAARDAVVIGMSVDPASSHGTFSQACGLKFPLLSDEDHALSETLGILNDHGMAKRTTFLIDKTGVVKKIWSVAQVDGHVDEILEALS